MGFSLISAAEVVYHCLMGLCKGRCSEANRAENDESVDSPTWNEKERKHIDEDDYDWPNLTTDNDESDSEEEEEDTEDEFSFRNKTFNQVIEENFA